MIMMMIMMIIYDNRLQLAFQKEGVELILLRTMTEFSGINFLKENEKNIFFRT